MALIRPARDLARAGVVLLAALLATACAHNRVPGNDELLVALSPLPAWSPQPSDYVAAALARSALADRKTEVEDRLTKLDDIWDHNRSKKLGPLCQDLRNATLDDDDAYRAASKQLLKGDIDDPVLEARLEQTLADDPLKLARRRRLDTWEVYWARTFNAVSEPLGQAMMTGFTTAPWTLAYSAAHYLASFTNDEPLSLTDRQALTLRKNYLARHPDSENAEHLKKQIEGAELKLSHTFQKRRLRDARKALSAGANHVAITQAERALLHGPNTKAEDIALEAEERVLANRSLRAETLRASHEPLPDANDEAARDLMVELLATSSTAAPLSRDTLLALRRQASGPRDGEAEYIIAMAQQEAGHEDAAWQRLTRLGGRPDEETRMARHARALATDDWSEPYQAFTRSQGRQRMNLVKWRVVGHGLEVQRYPNLPRLVNLVLDGPGVAQMAMSAPLRLLFGNWNDSPDFQRPTAIYAYRYLSVHPDGEHSREVLQWLHDYEDKKGNAIAALRIADFIPAYDDEDRQELAEKAARQALTAANYMGRVDRRNQLLRQVVREWPDTPSGEAAGLQARVEATQHTSQKIRLTRSFLKENPRVAGEQGLGLNPVLVNGELDDGELHPSGVTLLGGRHVQIDLVDAAGEEDEKPETNYKVISTDRLARLASILDQTSRNNQLIDVDDILGADADRDQFLERARLGLASTPDRRPAAQSTYVYRSMRERYGVVRGRESILPFDLVLQGSFTDLSLGAFPRWRPPKETPDSFLYR
jgi:hypothetical protein